MKLIGLYKLFFIILTVLLYFTINSTGAPIAETHDIDIVTKNGSLFVTETIMLFNINTTEGKITIWLHDKAENILILVNNSEKPFEKKYNEYSYNISNIDNTSIIQTKITYFLKNIENFNKKILYNTNTLTISYNSNQMYSGKNLTSGFSLNLLLFKPIESPLSWYSVIAIILLLILLVVSVLYIFKRQRTIIGETVTESEELLTTKKKLLLSLLRDIEKQYRSQQISNDTYHKLKDHYKQQAVETMKRLDDMKLKT